MMSDSGKKSAKKLAKPGNSESVKVVVRCRPMSERETSERYEKIVAAFPERGVIEVTDPKRESEGSPKQFTFDAVYDSNAKQTEMYDETFRPIVDSVLVGFNGTIFAYGQTGAGKTYTMEGIRNDPERKGVIPNSFDHIFNHIARSQNQQYLVTASYLEIYQEEIRDLLSKDHRKCEIKEKPDTGVYVKDLMVYVCKSVKEIEHVMSLGNQNRSVGATNMNVHSSRSHAIFIITVEHTDLGVDGENHIRMGKLNLVDLAGSERQAKTGVAGDRQKESIKINLSLSALGNVISALVDGKSTHIPYRDSKLTRLLQDSLGGNARTIMVANIGPASYNYDETLTTLRYASRAKNIRNRPQVNEDPKEALLKEFQEEIARLKAQLAAKVGKRKKKKVIQEIIGNGSEEEEEEGEEEESEEESEEAFLQKQEALLMEEHAAILNDQNLIAEEKEKLLNELLSRQDQLKEEQEARDQLHLKIQAMESKLLSGGKNIIDHTNEQQRELEQRRQELAEQKRLERAIQQKLVLEEETTLEIKETYTSLQQEVEIKTKKLKKLFARLQALKQEIIDIQEINSHERQEQEQIQNELMKQLKLTYLIIENFVPPEEKTKILSRVIYDEDEDLWCFQSRAEGSLLSRRPVATNASRRPVTERAVVIGNFSHHPRYKSDNICLPVLDYPMRTTQDYRYPSVDPLTRAVLDDALKGEEDEDIDVSHSAFNIRPKTSKKPSKSRPESSRPRNGKDLSSYPQSRGLVPK